ncbi:RagB/SusD family nutrient uptake outer membrane protein [Tamlana fucoidanivorans]|uniref:RagB/SusD family nutrient uptake outer membrane protein n=1 Tax=Allotamlana fucoidanivorans TaxID=2583814 RepID=A0A5C4SNN2_9FLAO|nr:RagB/SusD family nutrient uptake outer membrane protein [Tamlana fucoidanivorans]TNJ45022.1 RagB/SusD family nutrient uptake outer membrane protein [Tamlana fucoidanivorans]
MKNFKVKIVLFLGLMLSALACEEYLDVAPESVLTEEEVFSNFDNAQGFVDEMYALVVSYGFSGHSFMEYLMGDDAYNSGTQSFKYSVRLDRGELENWINNKYCYLGKDDHRGQDGSTNDAQPRRRPRVWRASMQGIRKANIVIRNRDLMVGLTEDERNVILGQAYFFRAYFHNEIMKFWGRFPYITRVFDGSEVIDVQRPDTYEECALAANKDYEEAIKRLPVDWDNESYGKKTLGNNAGRITKGTAYAFKGKNLLFAASPLMHFNNQPGIDTYTYNTELAAMAVDAFAEVLKLDGSVYSFAQNLEDYKTVFWNVPRNTWPGLEPGAKELIFAAPAVSHTGSTISFMSDGVPRDLARTSTQCTSATHNFIYHNFGMANGLSIEDDISEKYGPKTYDETNPFANRDPRFYEWIFADRDVLGTRASIPAKHRTIRLYVEDPDDNGNPGEHRKSNASLTGYMQKKFYPEINGEYHSGVGNNIIRRFTGMRIHVRLTDVYLMYAEALHVSKGANTAPASFSMTAEQVINKIRTRAGLPNIHPAIVADNNKFMDELRRERSVELSYEGHRWMDIRRWGVAHEDKYRIKTELRFDKAWSYFQEAVLVDRVCDYPKHYWLPFEQNQTQFYEGFDQNPGW